MNLHCYESSDSDLPDRSAEITTITDENEKNTLVLGRMQAMKINEIISRAIAQNFQGDIVCELKFSEPTKKEEFLKAISQGELYSKDTPYENILDELNEEYDSKQQEQYLQQQGQHEESDNDSSSEHDQAQETEDTDPIEDQEQYLVLEGTLNESKIFKSLDRPAPSIIRDQEDPHVTIPLKSYQQGLILWHHFLKVTNRDSSFRILLPKLLDFNHKLIVKLKSQEFQQEALQIIQEYDNNIIEDSLVFSSKQYFGYQSVKNSVEMQETLNKKCNVSYTYIKNFKNLSQHALILYGEKQQADFKQAKQILKDTHLLKMYFLTMRSQIYSHNSFEDQEFRKVLAQMRCQLFKKYREEQGDIQVIYEISTVKQANKKSQHKHGVIFRFQNPEPSEDEAREIYRLSKYLKNNIFWVVKTDSKLKGEDIFQFFFIQGREGEFYHFFLTSFETFEHYLYIIGKNNSMNNSSIFVLADRITIENSTQKNTKPTTPFKEYRVRDYQSFDTVIKLANQQLEQFISFENNNLAKDVNAFLQTNFSFNSLKQRSNQIQNRNQRDYSPRNCKNEIPSSKEYPPFKKRQSSCDRKNNKSKERYANYQDNNNNKQQIRGNRGTQVDEKQHHQHQRNQQSKERLQPNKFLNQNEQNNTDYQIGERLQKQYNQMEQQGELITAPKEQLRDKSDPIPQQRGNRPYQQQLQLIHGKSQEQSSPFDLKEKYPQQRNQQENMQGSQDIGGKFSYTDKRKNYQDLEEEKEDHQRKNDNYVSNPVKSMKETNQVLPKDQICLHENPNHQGSARDNKPVRQIAVSKIDFKKQQQLLEKIHNIEKQKVQIKDLDKEIISFVKILSEFDTVEAFKIVTTNRSFASQQKKFYQGIFDEQEWRLKDIQSQPYGKSMICIFQLEEGDLMPDPQQGNNYSFTDQAITYILPSIMLIIKH